MPRARRKSDDVYNERRRAKRLIARVMRQDFASARERKAALSYVANLERQVAATYVERHGARVTASQEAAAKSLSVQTRRELRTESNRANDIFKREIRIASAGGDTSLGSHGQSYVKIFYAATQGIWEGLPLERRDEAIMSALETDSLRDAFMHVMSRNRDAIRAARHAAEPIGLTTENSFFYEDIGVQDDIGSPPELDFVTEVLHR